MENEAGIIEEPDLTLVSNNSSMAFDVGRLSRQSPIESPSLFSFEQHERSAAAGDASSLHAHLSDDVCNMSDSATAAAQTNLDINSSSSHTNDGGRFDDDDANGKVAAMSDKDTADRDYPASNWLQVDFGAEFNDIEFSCHGSSNSGSGCVQKHVDNSSENQSSIEEWKSIREDDVVISSSGMYQHLVLQQIYLMYTCQYNCL